YRRQTRAPQSDGESRVAGQPALGGPEPHGDVETFDRGPVVGQARQEHIDDGRIPAHRHGRPVGEILGDRQATRRPGDGGGRGEQGGGQDPAGQDGGGGERPRLVGG